MQSRKIIACGESWKKSTILACQGYIFEIFGMFYINFSDINCIIYGKKVDFRLILTILIFLFAVSKLATQLRLKFLTHLISAIVYD